jgi:DNA-binding GntR family transcriptional regulator
MARKTSPSRRGPRAGTKAARATERLRQAILRGDLDSRRPLREVELSRRLGVSRVPVREALHQLEGEGLVEIRPHRGARVTRLSEAELTEIAEICRLLEAHVLRLAVPHLTPQGLRRAGEIIGRLDGISDPVEWSRLNWELHRTLYQPAERPRLIGLVAGLRANAERYLYLLLKDRQRRLELNQEHRSILAACRARRARRAGELLDRHLQGGKERVLHLLARR